MNQPIDDKGDLPPPFTVIPDNLSTDTRECLRQLADHGDDMYGIAFVCLLRGRHIIRNAAGECLRNPTYTRGMVARLDDFLRALDEAAPGEVVR